MQDMAGTLVVITVLILLLLVQRERVGQELLGRGRCSCPEEGGRAQEQDEAPWEDSKDVHALCTASAVAS